MISWDTVTRGLRTVMIKSLFVKSKNWYHHGVAYIGFFLQCSLSDTAISPASSALMDLTFS